MGVAGLFSALDGGGGGKECCCTMEVHGGSFCFSLYVVIIHEKALGIPEETRVDITLPIANANFWLIL